MRTCRCPSAQLQLVHCGLTCAVKMHVYQHDLDPDCESWQITDGRGMAHGGLTALIIDEALGTFIYMLKRDAVLGPGPAVTAHLEVDYKKVLLLRQFDPERALLHPNPDHHAAASDTGAGSLFPVVFVLMWPERLQSIHVSLQGCNRLQSFASLHSIGGSSSPSV